MTLRKLASIVAAAASAASIAAYARYRKDMGNIRRIVDEGSTIAETDAGKIEYAESGSGEPALVVHGAGGGYDQGLLIGRDLGTGYRVIAPSRFGYLKSPVPEDSSPVAQADAFAALLDFLGISKAIVLGASAGAPSAIELAIRHPDRVSALILLVPRTYDPTDTIGVDQAVSSQAVLRLVESASDFAFWVAMKAARGAVVRFLGVPPEVEANATEAERARVTEVIGSILPLSMRMRGLAVDGALDLKPWALDRIEAPTLIISAEDDLFGTLPGARYTASQIPGAELEVLQDGGHLLVGQGERVRRLVRDFLRKRSGRTKSIQAKDRHVAKVLEPMR